MTTTKNDDDDDDDDVDIDCVEMAKHIVKHFSQPRSRIISVLLYETASRNSQGNFSRHRTGGL